MVMLNAAVEQRKELAAQAESAAQRAARCVCRLVNNPQAFGPLDQEQIQDLARAFVHLEAAISRLHGLSR